MASELEDIPSISYRMLDRYMRLLDSLTRGADDRKGPEHPPSFYLKDAIVTFEAMEEILQAYIGPAAGVMNLLDLVRVLSNDPNGFVLSPVYVTADVMGKSREEAVMLWGLDPVVFTAMLTLLEKFGLPVNAAPWVEEMLPRLEKQLYIVGAERLLFAYEGERNNDCIELQAPLPDLDPYQRTWRLGETTIIVRADYLDAPRVAHLVIQRHDPANVAA